MSRQGKIVAGIICFTWMLLPLFGVQDTLQTENEDALKKLLDSRINTASKYNQTLSEAPASVTIITSEEIEQYGYQNIDDILRRIRGFYLTNDLNYSYVGIRGFSRPTDYNNRVLILLNGTSIAENVFGSSPIGSEFILDIDTIDRIEIVRGPGSVLYGTNAMLGVINIITRDGKTQDNIKAAFRTGDHNFFQGSIMGGKELKNGLDFFFSAQVSDDKGRNYYFSEFDSPETNNGIARNIDHDKYTRFFSHVKYKGFSVQFAMSSREKQIPTASYGTIFNDPRTKSTDSQRLFELKYNRDITYNLKLMIRQYFGNYSYKGSYPYNDPDYTTLQQDEAIGECFGFEGQFGWEIKSYNRLILGGEYKNNYHSSYKYWDTLDQRFDKNSMFQEWSLYIQDEYQPLKNVFFTFGLRYDRFSDRGEALSPRAAAVFNPFTSTTIKLVYGNAFRAPNFYELYYDVMNEAKENPNLKGEKIHAFEAILEQHFSKEFYASITFYNYEMKGLIEQVLDPEDELLQFKNHHRIKAKGMEAELGTQFKHGGSAYINYALQESKNMDTGEKLSNSPTHLFKSGISIPLFSKIFLSAEFFYESSRLTVYETRTDPFALLNFSISTPAFFKKLRCFFHIGNALNKKYFLPGGFEHEQQSIPQKGRSVSLKVEYTVSR